MIWRPLLKQGENVLIPISVDSHTEKQLNDIEREQYPASAQHLNKRAASPSTCAAARGGEPLQIVSDDTWRVRRATEGRWGDPQLDDADWARAQALPEGVAPVDEGPSLEPIHRVDFANIPVELGPRFARRRCSTAALAGRHRAPPCWPPIRSKRLSIGRIARSSRPSRLSAPTTLQALELTNGSTLNARSKSAAATLARSRADVNPADWVDRIYRHALARPPTAAEREAILPMLGSPARPDGVADFLWALAMLPEFQFID